MSKKTPKSGAGKTYGVAAIRDKGSMVAPELPYRPPSLKRRPPPIGLIGCGGITKSHLGAYRRLGLPVVALCDVNLAQAEARRKEFYPEARVFEDYRALLACEEIRVVDIATHPEVRAPLIEAALKAGKHVLSQKPFVLDLKVGARLVALARRRGLKLAVNQNGRWAPHFSYLRQVVAKGLIGMPTSALLAVHWDHNWIKDKVFNEIPHVIFYDFGIHWFDILCAFMRGKAPKRVYAAVAHSPGQRAKPPLLAQVFVEYEGAQAVLKFNADTRYGSSDQTLLCGTKGLARSDGPSLQEQTVTLTTRNGTASPRLEGTWFRNGFEGTMAELLRAIEEDDEPAHAAAGNLSSLALCFAAVASADRGRPVVPGTVTRMP